ncbi:MAG: hypothetical protein NTU83_13740, partial [Candidatus Hydrogenedentes bacterium]|nr:hypothetical protein [Candidatus Hydrogenedentota bacterium]
TIEGRTDVARELFAILANVQDELRRNEYLKRMAHALQLSEWACRNEFAKLRHDQENRPSNEEPAPKRTITDQDRDFIAALLQDRGAMERANAALKDLALQPGPVAEVLSALWEDKGVPPVFQSEDARVLYAAAANSPEFDHEKTSEIVAKNIVRLKRALLAQERETVQSELMKAERARDQVRIPELLQRKSGIERQIHSLGAA